MQCFDDKIPVHGLFIADSILSKKDTLVAIAGTDINWLRCGNSGIFK
jgi:hypothetical protein